MRIGDWSSDVCSSDLLLYAYLQRSVGIVAPGGRIGLVTADRWLLNSGSAELREKIGAKYSVLEIKRLESNSAFYRPKSRTKGTRSEERRVRKEGVSTCRSWVSPVR